MSYVGIRSIVWFAGFNFSVISLYFLKKIERVTVKVNTTDTVLCALRNDFLQPKLGKLFIDLEKV